MSENTAALETVLSRLDRWRHLPKYRLESRVDVLFGLTLPGVIKSKFPKLDCDLHVIPEFPIHHRTARTGRRNNQSFNVDFAVFSPGGQQVFLVELKTDDASVDRQQLENMRKSKGRLRPLVDAIPSIAKKSKQKAKYLHLVYELYRAGAMEVGGELKRLEKLRGFTAALGTCSATDSLTTTPNLVLVHPTPEAIKDVDVSGFCCIDFAQYADQMSGDPIASTLAPYLRKWQKPVGKIKPPWHPDASPSPDS